MKVANMHSYEFCLNAPQIWIFLWNVKTRRIWIIVTCFDVRIDKMVVDCILGNSSQYWPRYASIWESLCFLFSELMNRTLWVHPVWRNWCIIICVEIINDNCIFSIYLYKYIETVELLASLSIAKWVEMTNRVVEIV